MISPVGIHVEEAALPGVGDAALDSVEDIRECGAVADCDAGGETFDGFVFSFHVAAGFGGVFGRAVAFSVMVEVIIRQARVRDEGAEDEWFVQSAEGEVVEGERIGLERGLCGQN